MVMASANPSNRRYVLFAACILAQGLINFLVYSKLRQCLPSVVMMGDDIITTSSVRAVANEDSIGHRARRGEMMGHGAVVRIVPDRCDSPARGMQFDKIYASGKWFKGKSLRHPSDFYSDADWPPRDVQRASASGPGSDRGRASVASMTILKDVISKYDVKSMIDIPCGDVNWIFDSFETDALLPLYIGLDISLGVVQANKYRFGHHNNKHFMFWDATACALPRFQNATTMAEEGLPPRSVDLVHVRDVIQHMTLDQGVRYFCNVFESGARVLITTTFETSHRPNRGAREGGFYENNLSLEPFSFPWGDCVPTHPEHEKDLTCVYNLTNGWVQEFLKSKC